MNKTNRAVTAWALAASIVLPCAAATPKQSYNPDATPQRQELRQLSGFAKSAARDVDVRYGGDAVECNDYLEFVVDIYAAIPGQWDNPDAYGGCHGGDDGQ